MRRNRWKHKVVAPPPAKPEASARKGPGYERDAHYMGITDGRLTILAAINGRLKKDS